MATLERGLYEQLLTEALAARLPAPAGNVVPLRRKLHPAEAPDRLALHLARVVERALEAIPDKERVAVGTALVRRLIETLGSECGQDGDEQATEALRGERPLAEGELLEAMLGKLPDGATERIPSPLLPLLDTALHTHRRPKSRSQRCYPGSARTSGPSGSTCCAHRRTSRTWCWISCSGSYQRSASGLPPG